MPLTIYSGPMYSGKTEKLLNKYEMSLLRHGALSTKLYKATSGNNQTAIVSSRANPDQRYEVYTLQTVGSISHLVGDMIFIDEAQFLDFYSCKKLIDMSRRNEIWLAMLDYTWSGEEWRAYKTLRVAANKEQKLRATCDFCKSPDSAEYSKRITKSTKLVDEQAEYKPICSKCKDIIGL